MTSFIDGKVCTVCLKSILEFEISDFSSDNILVFVLEYNGLVRGVVLFTCSQHYSLTVASRVPTKSTCCQDNVFARNKQSYSHNCLSDISDFSCFGNLTVILAIWTILLLISALTCFSSCIGARSWASDGFFPGALGDFSKIFLGGAPKVAKFDFPTQK